MDLHYKSLHLSYKCVFTPSTEEGDSTSYIGIQFDDLDELEYYHNFNIGY